MKVKIKSKYFKLLVGFTILISIGILGLNAIKEQKSVKIATTNANKINAYQTKKKVSENLDVSWSPIDFKIDKTFSNLKINMPKLEINKSAIIENKLNYVTTNDTITYVIEIKNNSEIDAKQIEIKDNIPQDTILVENSITNNGIVEKNTIKWIVDVEKNQTVKVSFTVKVNKQEEGVIKNIAIVDGKETNEVINNFRHAAITATKSVSNKEKLTVGDEILYTITLINKGQIAGTANIVDPLDNGIEYIENTISNGGIFNKEKNQIEWNNVYVKEGEENKVELTFKAKVKELEKDKFTTTIKNTAIVNNTKTNTVENTIVKDNIKAVKTSNYDANTILEQGSIIKYTITLTNENGTMSKPVTITDMLPEGTTLIKKSISNNGIEENGKIIWKDIIVEPNTKTELEFQVNVNNIKEGVSKKIQNSAILIKDGKEESTNIVENTVGKSNLEIEKVSSKGNKAVKEKEEITYTINVKNTGTLPKENIVITDTLPEGTTIKNKMSAIYQEDTKTLIWNITKLEPNEESKVQFSVTVNDNLVQGYKIQNTGIVDGKSTNTTINEVTYEKQQVNVTENLERIKKKNIVMVIDLSSSMSQTAGDGNTKLEAAKIAAKDFITNIYKNGDVAGVNIQVLTFNNKYEIENAEYSGTKNLKFGNGLTIAKNKQEAEELKNAISNIDIPKKYKSDGYGTNIYEALKLANSDISDLKKTYKENDNVVVFLGDGSPTEPNYEGFYENTNKNILATATLIKQNANLYTIGFKMDSNAKALMENISSGSKYAFTAENSKNLLEAFSGITEDASIINKKVDSMNGYVEIKTSGTILFGKEYTNNQIKYTSVTIEVDGAKTVYKTLEELNNSKVLFYDANTNTIKWNVKDYNENSKLNIYFYTK